MEMELDMKPEATDVPAGCMEDSKGRFIRVEQVSDYEKEKDELVRGLIAKAEEVHDHLKTFKLSTMGDLYAFIELAFEKYDAKKRDVKNFQLKSFDGSLKVTVSVSDFLTFDEKLKAAKSLIDECLTEWAEDARPELQSFIAQAFEVDKEGNVSPSKILPLLKHDIKDKKWKRAMEAVKDSLTVQYSKKYVRFYRRVRDTPEDDYKWQAIPLDIAAL